MADLERVLRVNVENRVPHNAGCSGGNLDAAQVIRAEAAADRSEKGAVRSEAAATRSESAANRAENAGAGVAAQVQLAQEARAGAQVAEQNAADSASQAAGVLADSAKKTELAARDGAKFSVFTQDDAESEADTLLNKLRGWIDIMDFIPAAQKAAIYAGTSVYDAAPKVNAAAALARATGKGLRLEAARKLYLDSSVDLTGIRKIDIRCPLVVKVGLSTPGVTVGGFANGGICDWLFDDVTDGTSVFGPPPAIPVFRVAGMKRSRLTIASCNYLQFWADGDVPARGSNAYNSIFLSGVISKFAYEDRGVNGWNNENIVFGGTIFRYVIIGTGYPHNHNKTFGTCMEGASVSLIFIKCHNNICYGVRFEGVTTAPGVDFGADTYSNYVFPTWSGTGNPRNQFFQNMIPVVDAGLGNMVVTEASTQFQKTKLLSINAASLIVGNDTDSVAPSMSIAPGPFASFTSKTILTPSLKGFSCGPLRVVGMTDLIPVKMGTCVVFEGDYDGAIARSIIAVYDSEMRPLTDEGSGGVFISMAGTVFGAAQGYYIHNANQPATGLNVAVACVMRSEVAYIRVGLVSYAAGFYRHLGASIFTPPLGQGYTEGAGAALCAPRALTGAPTKGFAPLGYMLFDPTGPTTRRVVFALSTSSPAALASGATSVTVASAAGVANGDIVGILLTDGTTHWATVSALSGATFTVPALPSAASVGARVVFNRWA